MTLLRRPLVALLHATTTVALLLCTTLLPSPTFAFSANSNPVESLLSNVLFRKQQPQQQTSEAERGQALLKKLNLESNTEPRPFSAELQNLPALLTASMPLVFRLATGVFCNGYQVSIVPKQSNQYTILPLFDKYQLAEDCSGKTPQLQQRTPLVLYDRETCPFCRLVREAISMLSLDTLFRPCPEDGYPWIRDLRDISGQEDLMPYLMDPNTNAKMSGSVSILQYLFSTYGNGEIPFTLKPDSSVPLLSARVGLLFRGTRGGMAQPSNPPTEPLVVWSYEGSPFCKLVKEKLCSLEIQHLQISCPRGSPNRQTLLEAKGTFQVPYLQDPNTGVQLFESQAIMEYLDKQYAIARSPVKYM